MARLLHETARACYFNGLLDEAASLGQQALDLAERLGVVELQAEGLTTLAILPGLAPQEAVVLLERAIGLAEAAGLLSQAARAEHNLGSTYLVGLNDFDSARAHYVQAAELARQMGSLTDELHSRINAANVTFYQGMLVTVEEELLALRQSQAAVPDPGMAAFTLSMLEAGLLRCRGQLAEAESQLQALRTEMAAAGDLQDLADVANSLADVQFEMGEALKGEAAAHEAIWASEQVEGTSIWPASRLSSWYAAHGELEKARSMLSHAREEAAAGQASPWDTAWLSRAEAHLAAAEKRWPEAFAAFEATVAEGRRMGIHWHTAWFMREWAEALLARGEPGDLEQALSMLGQVAAEFDAIGAPNYAEQAKQRMGELARQEGRG
jgi:hypothetical protein